MTIERLPFPGPVRGNPEGMLAPATRGFALVTRASTDAGRAHARLLAAQGFDLIVVAGDDGVHTAVAELHGMGARVNAVQADLQTEAGVDELWRRARASGRPIEAAVLDVDAGCHPMIRLAERVVGDMARRHAGRLLLGPSAFALALRDELEGSGVTVTTDGATAADSEFFAPAG